MKLFKKRRTKYLCFHTGTKGMSNHCRFIKKVDDEGIEIINSWTTYHSHSSSHIPEYLHYVITFKQ